MKVYIRLQALVISTLITLLAFSGQAGLTHYDSTFVLATNVTKNYTFTDTNGLSVVVAVTITPYSNLTNAPTFTLLDFNNGLPQHLGIDSGVGSGDGNWINPPEGVDFTASLVSADAGIITNSIQFGVSELGFRSDAGYPWVYWLSPSSSHFFQPNADGEYPLDLSLAYLAGTNYSGHLRDLTAGLYQLMSGAASGDSVQFTANFIAGNGAPVVTQNPLSQSNCAGNFVVFSAVAPGDPRPSVQWQVSTDGGISFTNIPIAIYNTYTFLARFEDDGNQYRAIFTNDLGSVVTAAATLTVGEAPATPVIEASATAVPYNSTNTASGPAGAAGYSWSVDNGVILDGENSQTVTYRAGHLGTVTLTLVVENEFGCPAGSSTNVDIAALSPTLSPGFYVSDDSGLVEQFDTNGASTVFAFTPESPSGLAFDPDGNLYAANWGDDNTLRKIATNGVSSIIATDVNWPGGLAMGGDGNLYAADWSTIEKITTNGVVSTYITGIEGADGLAFDRAGNLYVPDVINNTIKKYGRDGAITLFATNGLSGPEALAFDSAGNLYVANAANDTIWKYDADGNGTVFAGTNLLAPVSLAFDTADNLYVVNYDDSSVTKFTPDGDSTVFSSPDVIGAEYIAVWPLPAQLIPTNPPYDGMILYGSTDDGSVQQLNSFGGKAAFATGLGAEQDLALDSAQNLYVVDQVNNLIEKYTPNGAGTVFTTDLANPIGLAIDAADNIYVNNYDDGSIRKVTPNGEQTVFAYGSGNLQGMAFDAEGNLYVSEYDNNRIIKYDTNAVGSIFTENVSQPSGLAFDGNGNLYVANMGLNAIEKFSASGNLLGTFAAVDDQPVGLAFDNATNLYVSMWGEVEKIAPDGTVSVVATDIYLNRLAIWPGLKAGRPNALVSTDTQVGNGTDAPSLSFINPASVVLALNFGGENLVRDDIPFTGVSSDISNPTVVTNGGYTVTLSAPSDALNTAAEGDPLFGSFIWASDQAEESVKVEGLDPGKSYHVYYLDGDDRFGYAFNMLLTLTASNQMAIGHMSWGPASADQNDYIYLPTTVSGSTWLNATMTMDGESYGAGFAGLVVVDDSLTNAPTAATTGSFFYGNGQFQFSISGTTGNHYVVEATTNLADGIWVPVITNVAPFTFVESNADAFSQRFYRVVSP